ncbi:uncharacterized protein LOC127094168 [Lathyrus oleraceus]|uniref:uncharacterized protein LOC127094168 n=1 Tax=Pisum sativum TaxID=3888 RepID=UPI0021CF12D4|nr:uncharacterized protein LOC127094168 [Pisum sativum]
MVTLLKSIDSKTWKAIIKGWEHPIMKDKDGKAMDDLKPKEDWSKEEDEQALGNSKALNALFNGVYKTYSGMTNVIVLLGRQFNKVLKRMDKKKIVSKEAIRGIPKLKIEEGKICGGCQIGTMQNGVVGCKNMTLQESIRVMLHTKHLPYQFWAKAMNTAGYIHNRVTLRIGISFTLYELWKGRKPTIKYFHVFGSKYYFLADREQRRKIDPKSDEGIFMGYSPNRRAYRVFNSRTKVMMESINVVMDDTITEKGTDVEEDVGTSS